MTTQRMPQLHVGLGWRAAGVTLFPIWAEMPISNIHVVRAEDVVISEREGEPRVSELVIANRGSEPILLLEGEILEGGWQSRMLNNDLLIAGHAAHVAEVTCVERGRWHGDRDHVRRRRLAPATVRAGLRRTAADRRIDTQSEVWRRVSRHEARQAPQMGGTRSESLAEHLDRVDAGALAIDHEIPDSPMAGQVGVVAALGGWPAWLELLPNPQALSDFWAGIVSAALLDAVAVPNRPCPAQLARDFAVACRALPLTERPSHGVGQRGDGHGLGSDRGPLTLRATSSAEGDLLHALVVNGLVVNAEHRALVGPTRAAGGTA